MCLLETSTGSLWTERVRLGPLDLECVARRCSPADTWQIRQHYGQPIQANQQPSVGRLPASHRSKLAESIMESIMVRFNFIRMYHVIQNTYVRRLRAWVRPLARVLGI